MTDKIKVGAVVGATASGKTALAVELAKRLDGEIISADSMQIYKGLSISTAKPTEKEMCGIPHHMTDFVELIEEFSVAQYCRLAHEKISDISARGKLPIVCGGTGLYVDSLLNNTVFADIPKDNELRDKLYSEFDELGGEALLQRLARFDPETASNLHVADKKRIVRAIEVYTLSGTTISEFNRRSCSQPDRYDYCIVGIAYRDRQKLYERINRRVDLMLEAGLIDEVKAFYGSQSSKTAVQAIGCKELLPYLEGKADLEECVEKLKMETRRFAKRQLTWFRQNGKIIWIYADEIDSFQELADKAECAFIENGIVCK